MTVSIYDEGLKACCSARFFALFGNCCEWAGTDVGEKWKGVRGREALKKELEKKIKLWKYQTFLVAILNAGQWKNIGKIFISLGFKEVACASSVKDSKKLHLLVYMQYECKEDNAKKRTAKDIKGSAGLAFF